MVDAAEPASLADAFHSDGGHLFGLLYRLTGSTADAEDLVQRTFQRALERPPPDTGRPWRPWLVRVAVNLGRDHLRRRKRLAYDGPWLPAPLDTSADEELAVLAEPANTEGRYELMESVSFAFLLALEALTPTQRAVLLLRDVFEYSSEETAEVLQRSPANVRQHLRRARRAMAAYERERGLLRPPTEGRAREILRKFLAAIRSGDLRAVEALLAEDVVLCTDAGGEFHAARVELKGSRRVARFYTQIASRSGALCVEIRDLNGAPAVVMELADPRPGIAPRSATLVHLDDRGRLARIHSILATPKLRRVAPIRADLSLRVGPA